MLQTRFN